MTRRQLVFDGDIAGKNEDFSHPYATGKNLHWRCIGHESYCMFPSKSKRTDGKSVWFVEKREFNSKVSVALQSLQWQIRALGVGYAELITRIRSDRTENDGTRVIDADVRFADQSMGSVKLRLSSALLVEEATVVSASSRLVIKSGGEIYSDQAGFTCFRRGSISRSMLVRAWR